GGCVSRSEHPRLLRPLSRRAAARTVARGPCPRCPVEAPQPRRRDRHLGPPLVSTARPAFYALAPGGWRAYVTLLHPPYTLWHLSYVCIGAALAPEFRWGILGLALLAFFLGM